MNAPRRRRLRRLHDTLPSRLASLRIMARRRPLMAGVDDGNGNGSAFGQAGHRCPWMWERAIRRGRWAGPWKRVRWDDA